jgi:hypothetical protein
MDNVLSSQLKFQFVTAIYTGLEGTRFNGNTAAIYDRYKHSLMSLAEGGYTIACFTSASTIDELMFLFKDHPNVYFIKHELEEYPLHNEIENIKNHHVKYITENAWRSRCVEIMWGKFAWLNKFVTNNDCDDSSIFWIDAGIFHGGLISNSMRSESSVGFFDFDTITQQRDLYADLVKFADDKIINIRSAMVNHGSDDYVDVFGKRPEYGIVGGIFGGRIRLMSDYILDFNEQALRVIGKDRLVKEEEIMYYLHHNNPDRFKTFEFNTWYHQDWPVELYNPEVHVSFSDFFKVIRA